MIELTEQQIQELKQCGWPPEAKITETGETFVLIHREMFERVRAILEKEDEIEDVEEMNRLGSEVWEQDDVSSSESA